MKWAENPPRKHPQGQAQHNGGRHRHHPLYQFTVAADRIHYVGTWNLANEDEPQFLNEKSLLNGRLQPGYEFLNFAEAMSAVPK